MDLTRYRALTMKINNLGGEEYLRQRSGRIPHRKRRRPAVGVACHDETNKINSDLYAS